MALTFNAINRAAAFNPTQAFPLDKRSYFESKDLAIAAAQTAAEPGTDAASNTVYYFGQTLVVNENNKATLYIIQPDKTLKEVGSLPVGDNQSVTVVDGKIQLVGFGDAEHGAVAQIKVNTDGTRTLVWTQISDDVEAVANRITALEGTTVADGGIVGAVKTVESVNGEYILKDSKGNEVGRIPIAEAVTNFAYHAEYTDKDGKTYDNVLVLELSNGEEQIIEIEDLIKIYKEEENAKEVQITITPSTGPTDPNDPASDNPNVISAKLTDSVKADIAKGVEAHEGLSHVQSDVQLSYSEGLGEHIVRLKDSVRENINKGVTAYNTLFDGTTTFVLNGGNASGYVVATDESTEV